MASVRVTEVCEIKPFLQSPKSTTELSLPLTFFDTLWIKFHPVERIFFYELSDSTPIFFNSTVLPKLKDSLSLALLHFLPLAGNLTWPSHAVKPFVLYTQNDTVSLTVAESDADFHHLSEDRIRQAVESRPYVPELNVSDTTAAIISFQITLFPNQGFCIGVASHHAILDGKSVIMFMKAWAHLSKLINPITLPPELTPLFDRTVIQDPEGIDMVYLNNWAELVSRVGLNHNTKSLKIFPGFEAPTDFDKERGTFELSREDIKKLRQKVLSLYNHPTTSMLHLSTFVLTYAYIATTIIKSKGIESNKKVIFAFPADCRARLDIQPNYFGNGVSGYCAETEAEILMQENGFAFAAEKLSEVIKELEKEPLKGAKDIVAKFMSTIPGSVECTGVAGSPRFEVYATDFGWGKPKKVELTSIDRTSGSFSMAESRDGSGGVEIGVVLKKHEMEMFDSLFVNGLKDI